MTASGQQDERYNKIFRAMLFKTVEEKYGPETLANVLDTTKSGHKEVIRNAIALCDASSNKSNTQKEKIEQLKDTFARANINQQLLQGLDGSLLEALKDMLTTFRNDHSLNTDAIDLVILFSENLGDYLLALELLSEIEVNKVVSNAQLVLGIRKEINTNDELPKTFGVKFREMILRKIEEKFELEILRNLTAENLFVENTVENSLLNRSWDETFGIDIAGRPISLVDIFKAYREIRTGQSDILDLIYHEAEVCEKKIQGLDLDQDPHQLIFQENLHTLQTELDNAATYLSNGKIWLSSERFQALAEAHFKAYDSPFWNKVMLPPVEGTPRDSKLVMHVALDTRLLTKAEIVEIGQKASGLNLATYAVIPPPPKTDVEDFRRTQAAHLN